MIRKMGKLFLPVLLCTLVFLCESPAKATEERDVLRLPSELKIIEEKAFFENASLDEVVLPEGLESIGSLAFAGSSVRRVRFPEGEIDIADDAFQDCPNVTGYGRPHTYAQEYCEKNGIPFESLTSPLTEFTFEAINDQEARLVSWDWNGTTTPEDFQNGQGYYRYVIIPDQVGGRYVTEIGDSAFRQSNFKSRLGSVQLPDTITKIGSRAFMECNNLTTVRLPENLVMLDSWAFAYCRKLEQVIFNENLKIIGDHAFSYCTSLTRADLPDSVEEFRGGGIFWGDTSLESIHYPLNLKKVTDYEGQETDEFLATSHFDNCPKLTRITVPEGVRELPKEIFCGNDNLQYVSLPSTLETIGANAFSQCEGLREINIPDTVSYIGDFAFSMCNSLTEVRLPLGLELAENTAFNNCENLETVEYPVGTTKVVGIKFLMTPLKKIIIPETATILQTKFLNYEPHSYSLKDYRGKFFSPQEAEIWTEYNSDAVSYAEINGIPYYYLSAADHPVPEETVYQGEGSILRGSVCSTVPISSVTAAIRNASGKRVRSVSDMPDTNTYRLSSIISTQLNLGSLPIGQYTYTLTAETEKSEEIVAEKVFTVGENPSKVTMTGFNIIMAFAEQGTDSLIKGKLTSRLPMTKVTVKAEVMNSDIEAVEMSATPNAENFNLEDLQFNINILEPGQYLISVIAEGEGFSETPGTGRLQISGIPALEGTINEQLFQAFIDNEDNKNYLYKHTPWISVGHLKERVLIEGTSGYHGFVNCLNIFFSNYQDYFSAIPETIFENFNGNSTGGNTSFYVDLAKEEIELLIQNMGPEYFETCGYDNELVETIRSAYESGEPLRHEMFSAVQKNLDWLDDVIEVFGLVRLVTDDTGEILRINFLRKVPGSTGIIMDSFIDFAKANAVLDLLDNDHPAGQYGIYYQMAVNELRKEYKNVFSNSFDELLENMVNMIKSDWDDLHPEQSAATLAGKLLNIAKQYAKPLKLANLFYKTAGLMGAYDEADAFVNYLMQVESFFAAEKRFQETFETGYSRNWPENDRKELDNRFRFVQYCADRALQTLMVMKEADYAYLETISVEAIQEVWWDVISDSAIPYLN